MPDSTVLLGLGLPVAVTAVGLGPWALQQRSAARPARPTLEDALAAGSPATSVAPATGPPTDTDDGPSRMALALVATWVGLGVVSGLVGAVGWPGGHPTLEGWLVYLGLCGTAVALVEAAAPKVAVARWALRAALAVGVALALHPSDGDAAWSAGAVAIGVGLALSLEAAARLPRAWGWLALAELCGATGLTLVVAGRSILLGQLAGTLAAACGVGVAASLLAPRAVPARAVPSILATLLAALLVRGHTYGSLPTPSVVLLVLAPLATLVALPLRARLGRLADPIAVALALVLACSAAAFAPPSDGY